MSTSEMSFNFCFCRFDIIEKAMSSVSSGKSRAASATGYSSPPIRITGNEPTFRCKSEAKWAVAVTRRSSIFIGIVIQTGIQSGSFKKAYEVEGQETGKIRAVGRRRRNQNHNNGSGKRPSTLLIRNREWATLSAI